MFLWLVDPHGPWAAKRVGLTGEVCDVEKEPHAVSVRSFLWAMIGTLWGNGRSIPMYYLSHIIESCNPAFLYYISFF